MDALIQRLEKASGPSRELDAQILEAIGGNPHEDGTPRFSESLDAALTLVPEGMEWEATNLYGIARASVGINADDGPFYGTSEFGSVPVALCIAALRARHSQPSDDNASDLANGAEPAP